MDTTRRHIGPTSTFTLTACAANDHASDDTRRQPDGGAQTGAEGVAAPLAPHGAASPSQSSSDRAEPTTGRRALVAAILSTLSPDARAVLVAALVTWLRALDAARALVVADDTAEGTAGAMATAATEHLMGDDDGGTLLGASESAALALCGAWFHANPYDVSRDLRAATLAHDLRAALDDLAAVEPQHQAPTAADALVRFKLACEAVDALDDGATTELLRQYKAAPDALAAQMTPHMVGVVNRHEAALAARRAAEARERELRAILRETADATLGATVESRATREVMGVVCSIVALDDGSGLAHYMDAIRCDLLTLAAERVASAEMFDNSKAHAHSMSEARKLAALAARAIGAWEHQRETEGARE